MAPVASDRPDHWCDYCGEPIAFQEIEAHKTNTHQALERELRLAARRVVTLTLAVYAAVGSLFFYGIVVLDWPSQSWWRSVFFTFLGVMMAILLVGAVLAEYLRGRVLDGTELRCQVCDLRGLRPEIRLHVRESHPEIANGLRRVLTASWVVVAGLIGLLFIMLAFMALDLFEVAIQLLLVALVPVVAFIAWAAYWMSRRLPLEIMHARRSWKSANEPAFKP